MNQIIIDRKEKNLRQNILIYNLEQMSAKLKFYVHKNREIST